MCRNKILVGNLDGSDSELHLKRVMVLLEDESTGFRIHSIRNCQSLSKLEQPEKNQALFRIPKRIIKTLLTDDNDNTSDSQVND